MHKAAPRPIDSLDELLDRLEDVGFNRRVG